jgi:hypothetical protein
MQKENIISTATEKKEPSVPFFVRYLESQNSKRDEAKPKPKPTTQRYPSDKEDVMCDWD